jgi:pimeloyl-ACP methyl ester carboxylesterase
LTIAAIAALLLPLAGPLQSQPAPLDTLVDVGGYHLHMMVYRGAQPLTIVMESGGGASLAAWSGVEARLAEGTGATVVSYDRAGFGESGIGPAELTAIVNAGPHRRLVVADGSDHDIPEMRPEAIVQAVLSLTAQAN